MKVQDNFVVILLLCAIFLMSCTQENNVIQREEADVIEKISNFEGIHPILISSYFASDGIKITQSDKVEYFVFDIKLTDGITVCPGGIRDEYSFYIDDDIPPYNIPYKTKMQVIRKAEVADSIIEEKVFEVSFDSIYLSYWLNTLDVFKSNNQYGAYFYTSIESYPSGLDPSTVVLWVFYNSKLYQVKGVIPQHEDWTWEDYYSVTFSKELENDFPEIHEKIKGIWLSQMKTYRKQLYRE